MLQQNSEAKDLYLQGFSNFSVVSTLILDSHFWIWFWIDNLMFSQKGHSKFHQLYKTYHFINPNKSTYKTEMALPHEAFSYRTPK